MQNVQALIQKLRVTLLILALHLLHTQTLQLQVLLVGFAKHFFKLHDLGNATLSSYDCTDCILDGSSLILQIFNFFDYNWRILLRLQPIYAIQKHCSVVVWNQICFPCGQELILQVVNDVALNVILLI